MIAYHRGIFNHRRIAVIHNFSNRGYTNYDIPWPGSDPNVRRITGAVELFNTDDLRSGGSGAFQNEQIEITLHNDDELLFTVVLSPLSTIVLEEILT